MSGASSLMRKKRDRTARSPQPRRTPAAFPSKPLERLGAAHEACRAILSERPSATSLQALATALRQIFQAEIAVLRTFGSPPLEGVSPRSADTQAWGDLLELPPTSAQGQGTTLVVEAQNSRLTEAGIDRLIVVPVDDRYARGALWLGYGKKAPTSTEELLMFDMLGDYLALALWQASAASVSSEHGAPSTGDDLVSQAAHDLRTPLTPISMLLQTLERKAAGGTIDIDSIGRARRQVLRLTDMVSDLVDLSRLREGRLLIEPTVIDLRDAVTRGSKAFGERDRRRNVEVTTGDEPLWVVVDSDRTVHAIASLLEHVARLAQGDGPIRACVERREGNAALRIDSERNVPNSGLRLELGSASASAGHRPHPLGLGVRLADALFTRLGGTLRIVGGRDGSACIEGTFPLAPTPSGERPVG